MGKRLPNILTTIRIICSLFLLTARPLSTVFVIIYTISGVTDILDGIAARQFNAESQFGEQYDSLADFIFIGVCLFKLLPVLHFPKWAILWTIAIAVIKITNLSLSFAYGRKSLFLHTVANKITGAMLFLTPLALVWIKVEYVLPIILITATFSAMQEGYIFIKGKNYEQ